MMQKYLGTTVLFVIFFVVVGSPWLLQLPAMLPWVAVSFVLAFVLARLSAVDVHEYRLPDLLTFSLAAIGILLCALADMQPFWWPMFSAAVGFVTLAAAASVYRYLRAREGIGQGDAKLLAAGGAWLGAEALPMVLLLATCSALVVIVVSSWRGSVITADTRLPFGPFLAAAIWIVWVSGSGHLLNPMSLDASGLKANLAPAIAVRG